MEIAFPPAQLGTTTPLADASAGVIGTSFSAAHADHVHPFSASYPTYQNAADNSKKFQRVASSSITINSADGNIFGNSVAVSFASTFAGTPTCQATAVSNNAFASVSSITTSGCTATGYSPTSGTVSTVEIWGLG